MLTIYYIEIVFCRVHESIRLYQEVHNFFPYQTMEFFFLFLLFLAQCLSRLKCALSMRSASPCLSP